jgi:putative ABC transport system permease protein
MSQRDLLRLVLSNLNRMRARVALTATGVLIGTAAIVVLLSLAVGLQSSTTAQLGVLGDLTIINVFEGSAFGASPSTSARESQAVLNDKALSEFRRLEYVVAVSPQAGVNGVVELKYGRASVFANIQGIDPQAASKLGWQLASGAPRLGSGQIVVGPEIFQSGGAFVFSSGGMMVQSDARSGPTPTVPDLQGRTFTAVLTKVDDSGNESQRTDRFRVAGVFEPGGQNDYSVFVGLGDVEAMNQWLSGKRRSARDSWGQAIVKVDDRDHVATVQRAIRQMGFSTYSSQDILKAVNQVFLIMQAILGSIGAVTLVVAAFGIANTMTMAIYERTKEIGIMKAVGATNRDVLRIFLTEAGAIGFLGGALGVAGGWLVGKGIEFFVRTQLQGPSAGTQGGQSSAPLVVTPIWLALFALSFATLIGVVSGIYPALRAASMKPLRALRME